jgi:hypothetical protein
MNYNWPTIQSGPGNADLQFTLDYDESITDTAACCAECFESLGCIAFETFTNGYCILTIITSGGWPNATIPDLCPNGLATMYACTTTLQATGMGPCGSVTWIEPTCDD